MAIAALEKPTTPENNFVEARMKTFGKQMKLNNINVISNEEMERVEGSNASISEAEKKQTTRHASKEVASATDRIVGVRDSIFEMAAILDISVVELSHGEFDELATSR